MIDRRITATHRAMEVAAAYETWRGTDIEDISHGGHAEVLRVLGDLGYPTPPRGSADLLSVMGPDIRIIEVKGRASRGPVDMVEREMDTLYCSGEAGWLYIVWNTTQPAPYELWVVQRPVTRLPWILARPAERPRGTPRGSLHEAKYRVDSEDIHRFGEPLDLGPTTGLPIKG